MLLTIMINTALQQNNATSQNCICNTATTVKKIQNTDTHYPN